MATKICFALKSALLFLLLATFLPRQIKQPLIHFCFITDWGVTGIMTRGKLLSWTSHICQFVVNILIGFFKYSEKVVLIVGHSFVKWAERRAEASWEPNLGLQSTRVAVAWERRDEMEPASACCPSSGLRPDVLVIHAGGNDLGLLRSLDLLSSMKEDVSALQKITNATVISLASLRGVLWRGEKARRWTKPGSHQQCHGTIHGWHWWSVYRQ